MISHTTAAGASRTPLLIKTMICMLLTSFLPQSFSAETTIAADGSTSAAAVRHPTLQLTLRQQCDLELLMNGGFNPVSTFMDKDTYESVLASSRTPSGEVFPMPITLDVSEERLDTLLAEHEQEEGSDILASVTLRDAFFNPVAHFHVTSYFRPDKLAEAQAVFGTTDQSHPAVDYLFNTAGSVYLAGTLDPIQLPMHPDFEEMRRTPAETKALIAERGWSHVVAFQTRNPMHRAHIELTRLAAAELGPTAGVLIHPVVGMTKPGDVDYAVRVRCYKAIVNSEPSYYGDGQAALSLLPLAMRMAGPREALWHAIIRRNYGATHFIVGRDHAGCKSSAGEDFYGPYDAQEYVAQFKSELGISIIPFQKIAYVVDLDQYLPADKVPEGAKTLSISGTKFRAMLAAGDPIPAWFSHPDVISILQAVSPPLHRRGFAVAFTGLSGAGKTTIASALLQALQSAFPTRHVTLLDGDVVRTHLSAGLGFSVKDRNTNVERIGWVASQIVQQGGIALCSSISPFERSRKNSRQLVTGTGGGYVLVHVATPVTVCQDRDVKGLYAKAAQGIITGVTGISHPFENPGVVELTIDGGSLSVRDSVRQIMAVLVRRGFVAPGDYSLVADKDAAEVVLSDAGRAWTEGKVDPARLHCPAVAQAFTMCVGSKGFCKGATPVSYPKSSLEKPEAERVEVAYSTLEPLVSLQKQVQLSSRNFLPYAESSLRVQPCLVLRVEAAELEGAAEDQAIVKMLSAEFPERVQVV